MESIYFWYTLKEVRYKFKLLRNPHKNKYFIYWKEKKKLKTAKKIFFLHFFLRKNFFLPFCPRVSESLFSSLEGEVSKLILLPILVIYKTDCLHNRMELQQRIATLSIYIYINTVYLSVELKIDGRMNDFIWFKKFLYWLKFFHKIKFCKHGKVSIFCIP